MSGAKRAKNIPSVANQITNLGGPKKGGLVPLTAHPSNVFPVLQNRASYCGCGMPFTPVAGLAYLKKNKLLSVNPTTSGGVGGMFHPFLY